MNEKETAMWIENVSEDVVSVFLNHREPYWRSMFYRKVNELTAMRSVVPWEVHKACLQRIKEKVDALPKEYTYARIVVNSVVK